MIDVKGNYKRKHENNLKCDVCGQEDENQEHILGCHMLKENSEADTEDPQYHDLFGEECDKMVTVARTIRTHLHRRNVIREIKSEENNVISV